MSRLPEPERNALLRRVDWLFLLDGAGAPRVADLDRGADAAAIEMVASRAASEEADVAVLGFPSRGGLDAARAALAPGGQLVCRWRRPRLFGARRARRRIAAAGFRSARLYWPGPWPHRLPHFWLPLDSPAAARHLLAQRAPGSWRQALMRAVWPLARAAGLLAPVYVIADRAGGAAAGELPRGSGMLLLTGGHRSINKVVGLPFGEGAETPAAAVKFARVPEAEPGLAREAEVLRELGERQGGVEGVPRLQAEGRRAGRMAIVESAVAGEPIMASLTPDSFEGLALRVTDLLLDLSGRRASAPESEWRGRLVDGPLERFEREFGAVLPRRAIDEAQGALARLGNLPLVCEHRDCSPWNVLLGEDGEPALLDWESAEPRGLPGLDLVYFLANSAFLLDHALESGGTRRTYASLLDPASSHGRVAARCFERYRAELGLSEGVLRGLRILCWVVHSRSDYRHLEMEAAGEPSVAALGGAVFPGLVLEELR